ncbi:uncharacterized protein LOC123508087 [Portunus trituberculatus]|uniref:uncharacterized protein LOC123508087 n=1 Tax=Portunus trituberculatus TaxID=210409 RepID=UPI001E1D0892|nr:uncharacterized protein LOC123508087 [Portunus trituberculatus]
MENYFREKKRFVARRKRSEGSGRLGPTTDTSQNPVEQDEDDYKRPLEDMLLKVREKKDASHQTYWLPESPYSLGGYAEYVPVRQMVVAASQAAVQDEEGGWSLQLFSLQNLCTTSLKVLVPGYPLEGILFTATQRPQEGLSVPQLDLPAVIDYMRSFFETGIHLLEVVQDKTRVTTRFVVGSWKDPRMPDLPFYTPRAHGGPFFRNRYGNYSMLKTVKLYRSARRLNHNLEFFISVSREQKTRLEEMCNQA